jgi:hypothetical protein
MRNGIYRVWLKSSHGASSGAVVFKNGDVFAADRVFAFNGRYSELAGQMTAEISCTRLNRELVPANLPDLDAFHLKLEGISGSEYAKLEGTVDKAPGFAMSLEYAFLCEA